MWTQGLYFKQALQSTIMVCGLADRKVVNQMPKYPEMPKSQDELQNEKNIELQRQLFIAKMEKWRRVNNSRNKK